MRLLADQDVYAATVRFLTERGHDVVPVSELGLSRAQDTQILKVAAEQGRILVTRDRDFGALVFVNRLGSGVVYLRMSPSTRSSVHQELASVLNTYTESELQQSFVVIESGGHRIRHITRDP